MVTTSQTPPQPFTLVIGDDPVYSLDTDRRRIGFGTRQPQRRLHVVTPDAVVSRFESIGAATPSVELRGSGGTGTITYNSATGQWTFGTDLESTDTNLAVDVLSGVKEIGGTAIAIDPDAGTVVVLGGHNACDSNICTITATGSPAYPNLIGDTGKPAGTGYTPTGWADDSGYVAEAAAVSGILSGYDHVVNSIASTVCGGGHNFIRYDNDGHNFVGGGSYNLIQAGRSGIVCGSANSITGGDTFDVIVGGESNEITGGSYSFIGSGSGNSLNGSYSGIVTGQDNAVNGNRAVVLCGDDHELSHNFVVAHGASGLSVGDGHMLHSATPLAETGDAQTVAAVQKARTTNDTATNMGGIESSFIVMPTGKVTAGTAKVLLVGMRDGSADGNNDGDYTQVAYQAEVGFWWDGTNGFFFGGGAQTSVTSAPTFDLTAVAGNTNNDFTPGAAPRMELNTGALRVRVTGIASTAINWVAKIDLVMTLVS